MYARSKDAGVIDDYNGAVRKYNSIKPIRGRSDQNTRPLASRRDDNLTIRMLEDQSVAVRFYYTDVVIYKPDNSLILTPYNSLSTKMLVRQLLGGWSVIDPMWKGDCMVTGWRGVYYHTPGSFTVAPDRFTVTGYEPFTYPELDRAAAKKALIDSGFRAFEAWIKTKWTLLGVEGVERNKRYWKKPRAVIRSMPQSQAVERLGDRLAWSKLDEVLRTTEVGLGQELDILRQGVYRHYNCTTDRVVDLFENRSELEKALRRRRTYG